MRVTLDRAADAAYIYLVDIEVGEVVRTHAVENDGRRMINLDFDVEWRLLGIEVIGASAALPEKLLELAEIIG